MLYLKILQVGRMRKKANCLDTREAGRKGNFSSETPSPQYKKLTIMTIPKYHLLSCLLDK